MRNYLINKIRPAGAVVKNEGGFVPAWQMESMIVVAFLGIIAAIAIPQYQQYKIREYDEEAQSSLKELYTACQAYWDASETSQPCDLSIISQAPYGYVPSAEINIFVSGMGEQFSATGQHVDSAHSFAMNAAGEIKPLP